REERRSMVEMSDGQWTIGGDAAGTRLDKFLAGLECFGTRTRAARALERGKVFLNGAEVDTGQAAVRLADGDVVRVWMDRPGTAKRRPTTIRSAADVRIIYEDDAV